MSLPTRIFLIIITLSLNLTAGGQVRLYTSENGLPNSQINRVYQDKRGYIWVATENGVSYFDGLRFTNFNHEENRSGSLKCDLATVIYSDSRDNCWIGTSDGLQLFDYKYNTFRDFPMTVSPSEGNHYVSSIVESPDKKRILVSVSGRGLFALDAESHVGDDPLSAELNKAFDTKFVGRMFVDSHSGVWCFSEQAGFFRYDYSARTVRKNLWSEELKHLQNKAVVSVVAEEPSSGNLIIGTRNYGLFVYDRSRGHIRRPRGKSRVDYQIRDILVPKNTMSHKTDGNKIWIGTEESGVKWFDPATENISDVRYPHSPVDLSNCKAHSIIQDSQGNVWIGIYQKGLMMIPSSAHGFEYISFSGSGYRSESNDACVTSVVRDRRGNLWVGTDGAGLFVMSPDGDIKNHNRRNTSLPTNSVMTITLDKHDVIWITTYMGGITYYTPSSGFNNLDNRDELRKISAAFYDPDADRIYFGTHGHGVNTLSVKERTVSGFRDDDQSGWINGIYVDSRGTLWVGSVDGLKCFDAKSGSSKTNSATQRMGISRTYSFLESADGTVWIGSADGLKRYSPATGDFSSYTKDDGLCSNLIYAIREDSQGVLWISTGHGLSRFKPDSVAFHNFYSYDGLQGDEFHRNASYADPDGRLYFGGINGLTVLLPQVVDSWRQQISDIHFSRLTVFDQAVDYDRSLGNDNILDRHITQARNITLRKHQNVFSIEFSVLEYTNPRKIVYGYMMEGFDSDWHYTDVGLRAATYTNLPDGRYRFRVKAFFAGDTDPDNVAYNDILIRILPPWYKTWWAYAAYLLLLLFSAYQVRLYVLRRRQRVQERAELDRKESKLRMFTDMSHEIRTPLTLVMNPLRSMRENETDTKRKELYNLMYRNVLRILRLINQLMDMRKIDNSQLQMHFNNTDMIFFIRDIMKSFDQLAVVRNIDLRMVTDHDTLDVWIDQGNFDKVIFNILSNAFKFTPDNGYMTIGVDVCRNNRHSGLEQSVENYVEVRVENSGSRIEQSELDRIFDRFYQIDDTSGGSGIGLHIAKMIVGLHHGTLSACNTEGGVEFTIRIPLDDTHLSEQEKAMTAKHKDLYYSVRPDEKLPDQAEYIEVPETTRHKEPDLKENKTRRSVVFVDDDADLGQYVRMELSNTYNIEVFTDAAKAWKVISTTIPDAVITDLVMPEADGISLCSKIRQNPNTNHIPVIIFTSMSGEESEQACAQAGADRYLTKPSSIEMLLMTIAQTIKTRDTIKKKYGTVIRNDYDRVEMRSADSRFVNRVVEIIRQNIENPDFSVDDLSREVGMSRVHLNRKLKEKLNISPSNLMKSIRLKQAAYLLVKHKVNVSEVAYKVGFSTHSYFSNNFREYFGMTPSEFVQRYSDSADREALNKMFEE